MNFDLSSIAVSIIAGCLLGLLYFGGLWLTVRKIHEVAQPGLLILASFVVRMAAVLSGFYFVMSGDATRLIACLAGFLVVRQVMVHRITPGELPRHLVERASR